MDKEHIFNMKVIILAAGRGSRLGERTKDRPKCMCTLCGKTLIERCLDNLEKAGCNREDIGIVTGYKNEQFDLEGVTLFHNANWETTNMFFSLTMAKVWLEHEPCLVCYSDIVFSPNAAQALIASDSPLAITSYNNSWELWTERLENPLEDMETFCTDPNGRLLEIGKRPQSRTEVQGQYMGMIRFTPLSWAQVMETVRHPMPKPMEKLDMTTLLNCMLERGYQIDVIPTDDLWLECDTEDDILCYEHKFADSLL